MAVAVRPFFMSYRLEIELQGQTVEDVIRALDQARKLLKAGYLVSINTDGPSGYRYSVSKIKYSTPTTNEIASPNPD